MLARVRRQFKAAETFTQTTRACENVDHADCASLADSRCGQDLDSVVMVDVMSADKRSALMSRIRGKNTLPELHVRKCLWHAGLRYRLHVRGLPGRPDLVLPRWKVAVFVHGCFWHHHTGCVFFRLPKTRPGFWKKKLRGNRSRDMESVAALNAAGWRVAVVWECALRADLDRVGPMLAKWVRLGKDSLEIEGVSQAIRGRRLVPFKR